MPIHPEIRWQALTLRLRNPFRLAYGATEARRAYWLALDPAGGDEDPGQKDLPDHPGWGEAAIPPYYGISDEAITAFWANMAVRPAALPDEVSGIPAWLGRNPGPAPARCALDLALHDRIARRQGRPLWALLDLPRPPVMPTSMTIAIAEPEQMARLAVEAARFPVLKIKLGSEDDEARLAAVSEARPDARLRVDANAGWAPEDAVVLVRRFQRYNLELVEQPVARHDVRGMGYVQARVDVPVIADESCQTLDDVDALAAAGVRGINLKLQKAGGLAPGLAMLRRARDQGLKVMLGCMIETSLGVTAMAHLAGLADWLDLDAPLLIGNDPFEGIAYDARAGVHVPERPGIGVVRCPA